jgi:hypothetical protein
MRIVTARHDLNNSSFIFARQAQGMPDFVILRTGVVLPIR